MTATPQTPATGIQVTALFRAFLSLYSDKTWKECETIGQLFNDQLESIQWISTDTGLQFDLTFDPRNR